MKKEKIPIPVSTLVLMIVTITYKLVLVVIGVTLTILGQSFIKAHLYQVRYVFYLGTALNVFCVSGMLVLVFHPMLARTILVKGLDLLEKMHLMKKKSSRLEKLNASMDQYRATAVYLREHVWVLVEVFAITVFHRFVIVRSSGFIYQCRIFGHGFIAVAYRECQYGFVRNLFSGFQVASSVFYAVYPVFFAADIFGFGYFKT